MDTELELDLDVETVTPEAEARSAARDADAVWSDFQSSISVLRHRIRGNGASDLVLAELVEDDLRQARIALHAIEEFLDDAIDAVGCPTATPADLIDVSDTTGAMDACEALENLLPGIRRRLGQVALRLTRR